MDGGLACLLYGPCEVRTMLGQTAVDITCETDFPFGDEVKITLRTDGKSLLIPLSFRVPEWTEGMTIRVNGHRQDIKPDGRNMLRIEREWHDGDRISIHLPMHAQLLEGKETPIPPHDYFTRGYRGTGERINPQARDRVCGAPFQYVKYGPLLFSLALRDSDENHVDLMEPFQFSLNIKDVKEDIKIEHSKMPRRWTWQIADAPIKLRVKACRNDWKPTCRTALPTEGANNLGDTWLTLVPYNVTKFRVTLFPKLK